MILDNLSSNQCYPKIIVYNNLKLPVGNRFEHPQFSIEIKEELASSEYDAYVLGVYQPKHKMTILTELDADTNKFMNIVHKGLDISQTSSIGKGVLINSKVSIAAHTHVGDFVSINRHVSVGHHTTIGNFVSINPGSNIGGNVRIGEGSTIGLGACIIDGISIGKNTIIGAGSIVTKDIPDHVVAYGSPCKIVRDNF